MLLDYFIPIKKRESTLDSSLKSLLKSISWRIVGTIDTMLISFVVTGKIQLAIAIGGVEVFTKIALYYFHERIWERFTFKK